jgi:hypothetical protein
MDIVSVAGATASLECAILLIAGVLILDCRRNAHQLRLLSSVQSTLQAADLAIPEEAQPRAA